MASLTVRQLDDRLKKQLRLRAARNGRSVEDEVRHILREVAGGSDAQPRAPVATAGASAVLSTGPTGAPRALLIIGGGIAAYKSLDLIRRLKERGFAVPGFWPRPASLFVQPLPAAELPARPC